MSWKFLPRRLWYVWLILVAVMSVIFYFFVTRSTATTITSQQRMKQELVARAEAGNITSFFQVYGAAVGVLAESNSIKSRDANTVRIMDKFVSQWQGTGITGGIVLTNARGIVQFDSNSIGTHDIGANLSDRDYFTWAKENPEPGEYYISTPVTGRIDPNKGLIVVPVASPVYLNGVFTGVLSSSVQLMPLTKHYLELLRVSDKSEIYLVDQDGNLLYANPAVPAIGSNILTTIGPKFLNDMIIGRLKDALVNVKEGSLTVSYKDPISATVENHLVSYSQIKLGSRNWLLVIADPIEEVTDITTPIYVRQTATILLIALTLLLFGIIVGRERKAEIKKGN